MFVTHKRHENTFEVHSYIGDTVSLMLADGNLVDITSAEYDNDYRLATPEEISLFGIFIAVMERKEGFTV